MIDALRCGLGRRIHRVPLSPYLLRGLAESLMVGRYVPLGDGLSYEAALLLTVATPTDDSATFLGPRDELAQPLERPS